MRKFIITFFIILILSFTFIKFFTIANEYKEILKYDIVVYSIPLINSQKLATLKATTKFKIISDTGNWLYIQTNSVSGWIIKENLNTDSNSKFPIKMYVNSEFVNIRSEPTINSSKLGSAKQNSTITVIEKVGNWYKIEFNNINGYILGEYLSEK